jgi:ketosteroid isomerase-like protein
MSDRHVEIVRSSFDAFERGDRTAMFAEVAPEIVTERHPPQPDAGVWHGQDGVLLVFADWVEGFDEFSMTLEAPVAISDSQVLARSHQTAIGKQSRAPIEGDFWLLYTFRNDRIVRFDIFASEAQARSGRSG